jgi:hypothetical protein
LRGQRSAALWTAPNRKLHQRIMTQPIGGWRPIPAPVVGAREQSKTGQLAGLTLPLSLRLCRSE